MKATKFINSLLFLLLPVVPSIHAATLQLTARDPKCDGSASNANHACFAALKSQLATARSGDTIALPGSVYFIEKQATVVENINCCQILSAAGLLLIPEGVTIQGGPLAPDGLPSTWITFNVQTAPLFSLIKANSVTIRNIGFRFIGTTVNRFPYGDYAITQAANYWNGRADPYPYNQIGSPYESGAVIWTLDSSNLVLDHLRFESATHDGAHIFANAILLNGSTLANDGTGGALATATNNKLTNLAIYDCVMGIVARGQTDLVIDRVTSDRRGEMTPSLPVPGAGMVPGHLIYLTSQTHNIVAANGDRNIQYVIYNQHVSITNITDGPNTYSNTVELGTFAIKDCDSCVIDGVHSSNPQGLIQSYVADHNVVFKNMTWISYANTCVTHPEYSYCSVPQIKGTNPANTAVEQGNSEIAFDNVSLNGHGFQVVVQLSGQQEDRGYAIDDFGTMGSYTSSTGYGVVTHNLNVAGLPDYRAGQTAAMGMIQTAGVTFGQINATITPYLTNWTPAAAQNRFNAVFQGFNVTAYTSANITVNWLRSSFDVPLNAQIARTPFQTPQTNAVYTMVNVLGPVCDSASSRNMPSYCQ